MCVRRRTHAPTAVRLVGALVAVLAPCGGALCGQVAAAADDGLEARIEDRCAKLESRRAGFNFPGMAIAVVLARGFGVASVEFDLVDDG